MNNVLTDIVLLNDGSPIMATLITYAPPVFCPLITNDIGQYSDLCGASRVSEHQEIGPAILLGYLQDE